MKKYQGTFNSAIYASGFAHGNIEMKLSESQDAYQISITMNYLGQYRQGTTLDCEASMEKDASEFWLIIDENSKIRIKIKSMDESEIKADYAMDIPFDLGIISLFSLSEEPER